MLQLEKAPYIVRCDRGTENAHIERIQKFIRKDHVDNFINENCFIYAKSLANQRIESFWARLRRPCAGYWIDMFKGITSDPLIIECLRLNVKF